MKKVMVVCFAVTLVIAMSLSCQAETLELLTWEGYVPKVLMDNFEKETGITVKPTYSNNEEMIAKLRATRGAGFDLAQPSQDRIASVSSDQSKLFHASKDHFSLQSSSRTRSCVLCSAALQRPLTYPRCPGKPGRSRCPPTRDWIRNGWRSSCC